MAVYLGSWESEAGRPGAVGNGCSGTGPSAIFLTCHERFCANMNPFITADWGGAVDGRGASSRSRHPWLPKKKGPDALPAAGPVTGILASRCFAPETGDEAQPPVVNPHPVDLEGDTKQAAGLGI